MLRLAFARRLQAVPKALPAVSLATRIPSRSYASVGPLTREFAQQRILDVLSNCDKVDAAKLTPTVSFTDLGLDSLDTVDALFYIEEEFTVEMPDHEADEIKTVNGAVDWVMKQPDAY